MIERVVREIAQVASEVRCSEDTQVFFHARRRTVYWSGGDADFIEEFGQSPWPPVERALLAIDGVDVVQLEAEHVPWDWYEGETAESTGWVAVSYERGPDVQAWDRWHMIEVLRFDPEIVDQVLTESGLPLRPYPADCPALPRDDD